MPDTVQSNINAVGTSAVGAAKSVDMLAGSLSNLSHQAEGVTKLPIIRQFIGFDEEAARLGRTLGTSVVQIKAMNAQFEEMSKRTPYSTIEIQKITHSLMDTNAVFGKTSEEALKVTDALTKRLGAGADVASGHIKALRNNFPELDQAIYKNKIGFAELALAYKSGGQTSLTALSTLNEGLNKVTTDQNESIRSWGKGAQKSAKDMDNSLLDMGKTIKSVFPDLDAKMLTTLKTIGLLAGGFLAAKFAFTQVVKPIGGALFGGLGGGGKTPGGGAGGVGDLAGAAAAAVGGGKGGLGVTKVWIVGSDVGLGGGPGGAGPGGVIDAEGGEQQYVKGRRGLPGRVMTRQQIRRATMARRQQMSMPRPQGAFGRAAGRLGRGIKGGARGIIGRLSGGLGGRLGMGMGIGLAGNLVGGAMEGSSRPGVQAAGGILSSAATGAGMGAMLGPWGALAGGVIGAGVGLWQEFKTGGKRDERKKAAEEEKKIAEEQKKDAEFRVKLEREITDTKKKIGESNPELISTLGGQAEAAAKLAGDEKQTEEVRKKASLRAAAFTEEAVKAEERIMQPLKFAERAAEQKVVAARRPMEMAGAIGLTASAGQVSTMKAALDDQIEAQKKIIEAEEKKLSVMDKASPTYTLHLRALNDQKDAYQGLIMSQVKLNDIAVQRQEILSNTAKAEITAQQSLLGIYSGVIGVQEKIQGSAFETVKIDQDRKIIAEQIAAQNRKFEDAKKSGSEVDKAAAEMAISQLQANDKILINQQKVKEAERERMEKYDKFEEMQSHRLTMLQKEEELQGLLKNPMGVTAARQKEIGIYMENAAKAQEKMRDIAARDPQGREGQAYRQAQQEAKGAIVQAAKAADYVRRTFAEEFTAMSMGMPGGSYLMGTAPSGFAQFGPAALTTPEGGVKYGKESGFATRGSQIEQMFGEQGGRSGFEKFLGDMSNAADGQLEASDALKGAAQSLADAAAKNGAELSR